MIYLILSVVFSVLVSVLLKIARKQKISIETAIGINYFVAVFLSWLILKPSISSSLTTTSYIIIGALGVLLPSIFVIMGRSVEHAGIVKSDAAQRLSLIIPIVAAFTFLGENIEHSKLAGVAIAFVALGCLLHKKTPEHSNEKQKKNTSTLVVVLLLLGVWMGYGTIDVLFKQMAKQGNAFPGTLLLSFTAAAICMWDYLFFQYVKGKKQAPSYEVSIDKEGDIEIDNMEEVAPKKPPVVRFNRASIVGGCLLGCLNFGNILFYLRAHQAMPENPSIVFAGMNMGVITLGTLVGAFIFKEKLSWVNVVGIVVALVAIGVLFFL